MCKLHWCIIWVVHTLKIIQIFTVWNHKIIQIVTVWNHNNSHVIRRLRRLHVKYQTFHSLTTMYSPYEYILAAHFPKSFNIHKYPFKRPFSLSDFNTRLKIEIQNVNSLPQTIYDNFEHRLKWQIKNILTGPNVLKLI